MTQPLAAWTPVQKRALARRLSAWFRREARDLPWRKTRDLYAIWISEVMLQQTQVVTVIPYYERFLAAFPTVPALAAAAEEDVLRLWEGLGYYRRARQLHAAARQIVAVHQGVFPESFADVLALPGIGRYTAGAILSLGRDQRLPILEANTVRVYSRLLRFAGDPQSTAGQQLLWQFAAEILPQQHVGPFHQAMMELGATLCTPRAPQCERCPLVDLCPTFAAGLQAQIPAPKRKTAFIPVRETAVIVRNRQGELLLRKCQADERWAGLWDFPRLVAGDTDTSAESAAAIQLAAVEKWLAQRVGLPIRLREKVATLKHGVTKYRITLDVYEAALALPRRRQPLAAGWQWVKPADLAALPLSVTGRKIADTLMSRVKQKA